MYVPSKTLTVPLAAAVAATLALGACSSGKSSSSGGTSGSSKVAVVIKGLDNPFFQSMESGVKDKAASDSVSVEVQAANSITDTTGQADKLAALANQDYSCFVVNPISGTNLIQGIAQLAAKHKTIVNIDSPVDASAAKSANATVATYIGTDNTAAGKLAGAEMVKLLPSGGSVAAIGGTAGDVTSGARVTGFQQGIAGTSSIKFTQTIAANWDRQEALTQAQTILRSNPTLAGFFVANDDMALGVARAIASAGKTGTVKVISVDGIKDALTAVQNGELSAVVAQYPYVIGSMGVEACKAATAGKTLPPNVAAPVELVTKADAAKALAATPKPFGTYTDPFADLTK
ncbi:substrate-binding domain-containing protein [Jatrophihabitans telluris]|uniref:Substrate-binding domain-containing protein n=1 Tax=Jatrophihabitans telluris TaxID=2038343 RepID=A0ABY4QX55_9ACTN|nr:substrate-binding domain-containing protein [Jatrophihabitans telluris]UQX88271.1 substrate-binding domain-containing protein [Jatrophihabitans telluris]